MTATRWIVSGALLLGALVIGRFAFLAWTSEPPVTVGQREGGRLAPCPDKPNCVSSQAATDEQRVDPLPLQGSVEDSMARLRRALEAVEEGGALEIRVSDPDYLHAEATSRVFRFTDDLEVLAAPEEGVLHVRSASRVGHSDLGVNRKRVEALRRAYLADT